MEEARKGGRPREGDKVKNAPIAFRTDPELKDELQRCARENGRSLIQEVERRLRRTLQMNENTGDGPTAEIVRPVKEAIRKAEELTGAASWKDNLVAFAYVQEAVKSQILPSLRPAWINADDVATAWARVEKARSDKQALCRVLNEYGISVQPEAPLAPSTAPTRPIGGGIFGAPMKPLGGRWSLDAQISAYPDEEARATLSQIAETIKKLDDVERDEIEKYRATIQPSVEALEEGARLFHSTLNRAQDADISKIADDLAGNSDGA